MAKNKCPKNWSPTCCCSSFGSEPSEKCWIHGVPDWRFCPYCYKFRYNNRCTSCGCTYGISVSIDKDIMYATIWATIGLCCLLPVIYGSEGESLLLFLLAAILFFLSAIIQRCGCNCDLGTLEYVYGPW